jgi:hypothetical protein
LHDTARRGGRLPSVSVTEFIAVVE